MIKLGNLLKSSIYGKIASTSNATPNVFGLNAFVNPAFFSTYGQKAPSNDRIYAPYSVYKGKAALSAQPIPPRFALVDSGGLRVKRQGYMMLTFSPSIGERKYDWERKQVKLASFLFFKLLLLSVANPKFLVFALSATEVGSLINLGPNGSCEFFHDPAIQTSNAGQVRKGLSVKPHADATGYFVSLTVANNVTKTNERITVPVSAAEFAVMRTSFSFALPHIMGWDRFSTQMPKLDDGSTTKGPLHLGSEWDR